MIKRKVTTEHPESPENIIVTQNETLATLLVERMDLARILDALVFSSGSSVRISFSRSGNLSSEELRHQMLSSDVLADRKEQTLTIRMQLVINQNILESPKTGSERRVDITRYSSIIHTYTLSRFRRLLLRLVLPNKFPRSIYFNLGENYAAERTISYPSGRKDITRAIEACSYDLIHRIEQQWELNARFVY